MDVVLNTTAPIFLLIFLGFLGTKLKFLPQASLPALSRFVLYFALPSVMVTKISSLDLREVVDFAYILVYAFGGLTAFMMSFFISKRLLNESGGNSTISGIGAMMPNSSFIGYPILLQYLDNAPVQAFAMSLVVENILFLPLGLILAETYFKKDSNEEKQVLLTVAKRVATNPIILSVFLGVLMSLSGMTMPTSVEGSLGLLASAAAPCALVVIGGSLVGVSIKGSKTRMTIVAVSKLLIFPATVFCLLMFFPNMPHVLQVSALLFAAVPMFSIYPIIGEAYGQRSFCSSTLMLTTLISFFSISIMLLILPS